jgi:hypothetical protein
MGTVHRVGAALLVVALAGSVAACGDDSSKASDTTTTTKAEPTTVKVTAVDYEYHGLPTTLSVGDKLTLTNGATDELHEMVVMRVPDTEKRPVGELAKLPDSELGTIFAAAPAAVLLAPPGGAPQIPAVGDGTIAKAGRYVVICSIPLGADPQAYLNAPPSDGPPNVAGGPPHFTKGMYGEFTVK